MREKSDFEIHQEERLKHLREVIAKRDETGIIDPKEIKRSRQFLYDSGITTKKNKIRARYRLDNHE